jgi:hypothetical protein
MRALVTRFLNDERDVARVRREKALNVLHETFIRYRAVCEHSLVMRLVIPVLKDAVARERDAVIQVSSKSPGALCKWHNDCSIGN